MIVFKQTGDFRQTEKMLTQAKRLNIQAILKKYGAIGADALSSATPVDTGLASNSWGYEIVISQGSLKIYWTNTNIEGGASVVMLLQYGHGTKNGGYIQGRDYINPVMQPIFDKIVDEAWKEVTK